MGTGATRGPGLAPICGKEKVEMDHTKVLKRAWELTWRYRVLIHHGDTNKARVVGHYHNFAHPPQVTVKCLT